MRKKAEILDSAHWNFVISTKPPDVSLIHSLHTLEVLIDARDILKEISNCLVNIYSEFPGVE